MYKSDFLNEISSRGFIYQASDIDALDVLAVEFPQWSRSYIPQVIKKKKLLS